MVHGSTCGKRQSVAHEAINRLIWRLHAPARSRDRQGQASSPSCSKGARTAKNRKTEFDKRKKDPSHTFRLKYKSRMDASLALPVYHKHWKDGGV